MINEWFLVTAYTFFILTMFYMYQRLDLGNYYKVIFLILIALFFTTSIGVNIIIDGNSLNVDRWSAMEVGINALFNSEYPYSAIDHLDGRTSNLPTLLFIGIPFYLMGDVGFLQSFCFLVFSFVVYRVFTDYKTRLLCLLFLIFSPSYLWEIYCKSDLMSNFILVLLLLIFCKRIYQFQKTNPTTLSFFATALVLTRLTVIIPISMIVIKAFFKFSLKEKTVFICVSILTVLIFCFICFRDVISWDHFLQYNPLELQNRQLPFTASLIMVFIPIIYSFRVDKFKALIKASFYFLLLPVFLALLIKLHHYGWNESIINSAFDISYLNIVMPFLLVVLGVQQSRQKSLGQ